MMKEEGCSKLSARNAPAKQIAKTNSERSGEANEAMTDGHEMTRKGYCGAEDEASPVVGGMNGGMEREEGKTGVGRDRGIDSEIMEAKSWSGYEGQRGD